MEVEPYSLHLNRTHLLFVPKRVQDPDSTPKHDMMGTVVQVSLRAAEGMSDREERVFALERMSITRTIETLVVGHVNAVCRLPGCVTISGAPSVYTLVGVKKAWKYGRGKQFFLGDVALQPAEDKWLFRFQVAKWDAYTDPRVV